MFQLNSGFFFGCFLQAYGCSPSPLPCFPTIACWRSPHTKMKERYAAKRRATSTLIPKAAANGSIALIDFLIQECSLPSFQFMDDNERRAAYYIDRTVIAAAK